MGGVPEPGLRHPVLHVLGQAVRTCLLILLLFFSVFVPLVLRFFGSAASEKVPFRRKSDSLQLPRYCPCAESRRAGTAPREEFSIPMSVKGQRNLVGQRWYVPILRRCPASDTGRLLSES